MLETNFEYKIITPDTLLSDFVERFWMVANYSEIGKEIVLIPDGRIDIFFFKSKSKPFHIMLLGLETKPTTTTFTPKSVMFGISFKLLSVEYLLDSSIANILNHAQQLHNDFWGISENDLSDFETFCNKVSKKILKLIKPKVDKRKRMLFELLYTTQGSLTVAAYSEKVCWQSRQINRYFNEFFGLSLKAYCNILRFRASFQQIKEGNLFPEQNFSDQAHFARDVKKLSGVVPKELSKNKNDRFLQFSTLSE